MTRPKPLPGELHVVDPYFQPPGLPPISVETKRWCLASLDRLITSLTFRLEGFYPGPEDRDGTVKWIRKKRLQWKRQLVEYRWQHHEISRMTCIEHKHMSVTD